MKKVLLMLSFLFLLTGCSASYELEIKEDKFSEKIILNDMNVSDDLMEVYLTNAMPFDYQETSYLYYDKIVKPYEIERTKGNKYYDLKSFGQYGIEANFSGKFSDYKYSNALHSTFNSVHVNNYEDYISIYGFDGVSAFSNYSTLDRIDVKIKVDKTVREHDADEVNGNTYIWHFYKNNPEKSLYIEMDSNKVIVEQEKPKITKNINYVPFIILGGILVVVIVFGIYMKFKMNSVNKI